MSRGKGYEKGACARRAKGLALPRWRPGKTTRRKACNTPREGSDEEEHGTEEGRGLLAFICSGG